MEKDSEVFLSLLDLLGLIDVLAVNFSGLQMYAEILE